MNGIFNVGWLHDLGIVVMLYGVVVLWRGLAGGRNGERGLVRRGIPMLDRLEGWRTTLVGLTLFGFGAAWFWGALWLLALSLGIGFVELREASQVITAWRWDGGGRRKQAVRPRNGG